MDKETILMQRELYYKNTFILFEIVKCLKNRELCFLTQKTEEKELKKKAVRYLIAFNLDYLKSHFNWFNFEKSLLNMYHSVARLKDIPVFSYNIKERRKEEDYKEFNTNYDKYVTEYNFFVDFDGKDNFEECHREAKEFKKVLNEYKVPYYILNSSLNGFHFHIPSEYMPKENIFELLKIINNVVYNIKGVYDLNTLDSSVVDIKRVCKVPYSYSCDGSICLPLNDAQFEHFNKEMVKMSTVLRNVRIKNRGKLTRTHNLSDEELKKNVIKFLKDFSS